MSRQLRSDYKIEKKGPSNLAVFHLSDEKRKGYEEIGTPEGRIKHIDRVDPTAVFDEAALLFRIGQLEAGGQSASLEKAALYALQRANQMQNRR